MPPGRAVPQAVLRLPGLTRMKALTKQSINMQKSSVYTKGIIGLTPYNLHHSEDGLHRRIDRPDRTVFTVIEIHNKLLKILVSHNQGRRI